MKPRKSVLDTINIPRAILCHTIGEDHTHAHRICMGSVMIVFGVCVSAFFQYNLFVKIIAESVGFLIHNFGAIPIIDYFIQKQKTNENKTTGSTGI